MTTIYGLTLRVGPGAKGQKVAYQLILSATTALSRSLRPRKSMKPDQGNTASESWTREDSNPRWIAPGKRGLLPLHPTTTPRLYVRVLSAC